MNRLLVAKVVYYVLAALWLVQISLQGYTRELIVPTIVLIVYGLWLRSKMNKSNINNH